MPWLWRALNLFVRCNAGVDGDDDECDVFLVQCIDTVIFHAVAFAHAVQQIYDRINAAPAKKRTRLTVSVMPSAS